MSRYFAILNVFATLDCCLWVCEKELQLAGEFDQCIDHPLCPVWGFNFHDVMEYFLADCRFAGALKEFFCDLKVADCLLIIFSEL